MSLVLSRKENQRIVIAGPCEVEVRKIEGSRVRLAVHAEREVLVLRAELCEPAEKDERFLYDPT